jgi:hypothetical protein
LNQFQAIQIFQSTYGPSCMIGWIKETKLYGLQSASY